MSMTQAWYRQPNTLRLTAFFSVVGLSRWISTRERARDNGNQRGSATKQSNHYTEAAEERQVS